LQVVWSASPVVNTEGITVEVVVALLGEQFPRWAHMPVRRVDLDGNDNTSFRLGDELLVRLPSHERYVLGVEKEHRWLPILAKQLPLPIPRPVATGKPSDGVFPRIWSVYEWLDGEIAGVDPPTDLSAFARDVADFLAALYSIDASGGPPAGEQSFWRGAPLDRYDHQTRKAIADLGNAVPADAATSVWDAALAARYTKRPVWVHGDVAQNNLLVRDGRLCGVIDFGTSAIGDPACDTVLAWTFLTGESRRAFRERLPVDHDTWVRGRGGALWKALITLAWNPDAAPAFTRECERVVADVIAEHELEARSAGR
jgi:aminoglycoside phosphotransferase (APT) family kinase protein